MCDKRGTLVIGQYVTTYHLPFVLQSNARMNPLSQLTDAQLKEAVHGPPDIEWRWVQDQGRLVILNALSRYEMRRQCQEIVPQVLLGPFMVSKSLETLQELGVTHMYAGSTL
jgi:hypothetical protein